MVGSSIRDNYTCLANEDHQMDTARNALTRGGYNQQTSSSVTVCAFNNPLLTSSFQHEHQTNTALRDDCMSMREDYDSDYLPSSQHLSRHYMPIPSDSPRTQPRQPIMSTGSH